MTPQTLDVSTPEGQTAAFLQHGATLADLHGISAEELEAVYARGYDAIAAGQWNEALDDMAFVVRHNPWEQRYHFAFALCLHHLRQYEAAGNHYSQALLLDATDAVCAFRLGECLGALGHLSDAREAFETVVKLSYLKAEYADVRAQAQQRLDVLAAAGA